MPKFQLSCSSTTDLTREYFIERNINLAYFNYTIDGMSYRDDFGESMPLAEFYARMDAGSTPVTSQINVDAYIKSLEPILSAGQDIIHITLSSGISGAYSSAKIAEGELKKKYPDRKLYIVDSLGASAGYGLLVDKICDMRDADMDVDETAQWLEENKLRLNHWFFTSDLKHLRRGGRISGTEALIGSMLNICPVCDVSRDGKLIPRSKVRGKKNVIAEMLERMKQNADGGTAYSGKVFISNSACLADAEELAGQIRAAFPNVQCVNIYSVGTVIGSHTGPGTVALFFWGKKRVD